MHNPTFYYTKSQEISFLSFYSSKDYFVFDVSLIGRLKWKIQKKGTEIHTLTQKNDRVLLLKKIKIIEYTADYFIEILKAIQVN